MTTTAFDLQHICDQNATAKQLLALPDCRRLETIFAFPPDIKADNITLSTLTGPALISATLIHVSDSAGQVLALYALGRKLAGHAGLVHGGLPALLLDDCMGRACFPLLSSQVGVTARLEMDYKAPIRCGSVVLVSAKTVEVVEARKAWVDARVEDPETEEVYVRARGLFVQPKWVGDMVKVL